MLRQADDGLPVLVTPESAESRGFPQSCGYPNSWIVDKENSHLEMDDDWGYPHFRKKNIFFKLVGWNMSRIKGLPDSHAHFCRYKTMQAYDMCECMGICPFFYFTSLKKTFVNIIGGIIYIYTYYHYIFTFTYIYIYICYMNMFARMCVCVCMCKYICIFTQIQVSQNRGGIPLGHPFIDGCSMK